MVAKHFKSVDLFVHTFDIHIIDNFVPYRFTCALSKQNRNAITPEHKYLQKH